jgi:LysM repeat protein
MKNVVFLITFIGIHISAAAQRITPEQYIDMYKDLAVREMKRMGIPAAITLAQGILEAESGNSDLVKKSNNHFGIKCKGSWSAEGVSHDDDEKGECFRVYKTAEDSYRDHSNFLRNNQRYGSLFKIDVADYQAWAYGLKKAGYATNPSYPQMLIKHIEKYNLNQYTLGAINDVPKFDASLYEDDKENIKLVSFSVTNSADSQQNPVLSSKKSKTYINGLRAVYVQKGTSLFAIADEYKIELSKLLEFNDLYQDNILTADQWIFLEKKYKQGNKKLYTVQEHETLYDIAQNNAIQLEYLLQYNNLQPADILVPGTTIKLKPTLPDVANEIATEKKNIHTVQSREGLYAISRKYNITIEQIKEWNHLDTDELKIGQEIIIAP